MTIKIKNTVKELSGYLMLVFFILYLIFVIAVSSSNIKYLFLCVGSFFFSLNSFCIYYDLKKTKQMILELVPLQMVLTLAILQYFRILNYKFGFLSVVLIGIVGFSRYSLAKSTSFKR